MTEELKLIQELGSSFDAFQKKNDERIAAIEKGRADVLDEIQTDKINKHISDVTEKLEKFQAAMNRPAVEEKSQEDAKATEYKNAFNLYLKKGQDFELKALSSSVDADGGYLVSPQMGGMITTRLFETSPMRQIANVTPSTSGTLEFVIDNDEASCDWASEMGARPESTSPNIGKEAITAHEVYSKTHATQTLLDDAAVDVETWLAGKIADAFSRKENTAFVTGNGVGRPKGFLSDITSSTSYDAKKVQQLASASSGVIVGDDVIKLLFALKDGYRQNAKFVCNRATMEALRKLKQGTSNEYIFDFTATGGMKMLGLDVIGFEDMEAPAANSLSLAVGDFKQGYQIVDRKGLNLIRDPFSAKPYIEFYATKRVGGMVVNAEAIKVLKLGSI